MSTARSPRLDLGLLLIRVMVGIVFLFHGSQKLFGWFGGYGIAGTGQWMESIGIPFGALSAFLAGAAEFGGGAALVTGLFLGWAAIPLTFTMLVAAFTAHASAFSVQQGGMEYALTLAVVVAGLGLSGPGRYALRVPVARRAAAAHA